MFSPQYLAGFFDGEGSVDITSNHTRGFSVRVTLPQSGDRGFTLLTNIAKYLERFGIFANKIYTDTHSKLSKQPCYKLVFARREQVVTFLTMVMPYLHIKKLEAQDCLRMLQFFPKLPSGGRWTWESRRRNLMEAQKNAISQ